MTRPASPSASLALLTSFALFMGALGVTTFHLGTRSLIFDEATSVLFARGSLSALGQHLTSEPNQSLYYALLFGWIRAAGESEASIRLPSAVAISLSAPGVFLLGYRLIGFAPGLWGALFFLANAFIVRFAQTARAYGIFTLLTLLTTLLFVEELARPSRRTRLAYVVASVLAIYAHFFAAWTLAAHAVIVLVGRGARRPWLRVAVAVAIGTLPIAWLAINREPAAVLGWIPPLSVGWIKENLRDFGAGSTQLLIALAALGLLGIAYATTPRGRRPATAWHADAGVSPHVVLLALFAVPIAIALALSFVQPVFVSYYLIACVPAQCLLAASAWPALGGRSAPLVMGAVLLLSLGQLPSYDAVAKAENWRDATRHILDARRPDDAFVFVPDGAQKPFDYYTRQAGLAEIAPVQADVAQHDRVWLLIRNSDVAVNQRLVDELHGALARSHRRIAQPEFSRLTLELWER